ncbi:uncharacterized protein DS421_7g216200 [Arachis hypogaea]|nr:uncharacterized protein DS421_7g216200 [Arachis hypogaea]
MRPSQESRMTWEITMLSISVTSFSTKRAKFGRRYTTSNTGGTKASPAAIGDALGVQCGGENLLLIQDTRSDLDLPLMLNYHCKDSSYRKQRVHDK